MVEIDIQHRHPAKPVIQRVLGGNGCIVEEAVATELVGGGMMARRATQSECRLAGGQAVAYRGQGDVLACLGRLEGALADRGVCRKCIVAKPPIQVVGQDLARHGTRRPDPGDRLTLRPRERHSSQHPARKST